MAGTGPAMTKTSLSQGLDQAMAKARKSCCISLRLSGQIGRGAQPILPARTLLLLRFHGHRDICVCRQSHPVAFHLGDETLVDEMVMAFV
jgi:hypothetical protein